MTAIQKRYLKALGLSADAIQLYEMMTLHGPLTAQKAASYTSKFSSACYRLFYQLEDYGLVRRKLKRPLEFTGLPIQNGFPAALLHQKQVLTSLLSRSITRGNTAVEIPLRLVVGRQALYSEYARLAPQVKHRIDIYSIGIAYSEQLLAVQRAAIKRGVSIRHVVQQLRPSNYHVVHAWQHMGVRMRLGPTEHGFHFMVFDERKVIISFSNAHDTDDRLSIITDNPAVVRLCNDNFQTIWQNAQRVSV